MLAEDYFRDVASTSKAFLPVFDQQRRHSCKCHVYAMAVLGMVQGTRLFRICPKDIYRVSSLDDAIYYQETFQLATLTHCDL